MTAKLQPPVGGSPIRVTIVRKLASPDRYRRLVHLLAVLLDKPDAPEESR